MYHRFVIPQLDDDSTRRQGVFQAVYELLKQPDLPPPDRSRLEAELDWFRANLPAPDRFARSCRAGAAPRAIGWFKASAAACVSRMHAISRILAEHGQPVEVLKTERPGYIVYEDEFQVAAEPFSETPT